MNDRTALFAARWNSRSAIAGRMLRSRPAIAPTKPLTATRSANCATFSRSPSRTPETAHRGSRDVIDLEQPAAGPSSAFLAGADALEPARPRRTRPAIPPSATPGSRRRAAARGARSRSEEHTSELQSLRHLVCRLLLEKKNYI